VEAWACSSETGEKVGEKGKKRQLCDEVRAARWLLVPVLIAGLVMLGSVVWEQFGGMKEKDTRTANVGAEEGKVQGPV
jgi:hypothetical protein